MRQYKKSWSIFIVCLMLVGAISARNANMGKESLEATEEQAIISPDQLRHVIVHDAGNLYCPFYDGFFSLGYSPSPLIDPETDEPATLISYPKGSNIEYVFFGAIWVGGIVNNDTLVSCMTDGWARDRDIFPADRETGGSYRTGDFADDEFITTVYDTADVPDHTPLNIEIKQKSYSWSDSLYDDFVIVDYTIKNIGNDDIADGWAGILLDNDIYGPGNIPWGYADDCSGFLDTLLDVNDPSSRALIGYSFDNNGDPSADGLNWNDASPKGAISLRLLGTDFAIEHVNFNWWMSNATTSLDFGPRRTGSPEDPFYVFSNGALGTPGNDPDQYYLLSHPEVDYDQISTATEDSAAGWIPPVNSALSADFSDGYDTRFMLSFGPFDIAAGDSITFSVALVGSNNLHANPSDFADYFDPDNPSSFYQTLDFSELLLHHKRAEEVYQSGNTLPVPGPPIDLQITAFDDDYVDLVWRSSHRPDLDGYNIYYRDTQGSNVWYLANSSAITDTAFTVSVSNPLHRYEFAVTIENSAGAESNRSDSVSIVPNAPQIVTGLAASLQGIDIQLKWDISQETNIEYYTIYRSEWSGEAVKLDSTASDYYVDASTESGIRYDYYITATNAFGNESLPSRIVSQIPMARNRGVLFIDASRGRNTAMTMYFDTTSFESMFSRLYMSLPVTRHIVNGLFGAEPVTFKEMSEYSHLVVFLESRSGNIVDPAANLSLDSIGLFLSLGGKAVITTVSADFAGLHFTNVITTQPQTVLFYPGDIEYDIFKLDSAVRNPAILATTSVLGDLVSCASASPDYVSLVTDTLQLRQIAVFSTYLPGCGYLYPQAEAEPIYSYVSSVPDTINNGQINGIRYLGNDYQFIMFNFPLTVMQEDDNFTALLQALGDLGVHVGCGDANGDGGVNVGDAVFIIRHIFLGGPSPADAAAGDINCDGAVDVGDAVGIINYIFRDSSILKCCP